MLGVSAEAGHNEVVSSLGTLPITTTIDIPAGALAILGCANATPATAVTGIADTRSNTWVLRSAGSAGANARATIAEALITTSILAGDTITITWGGNVAVRIGSVCFVWGQAPSAHDQAGTGTGSATATWAAATAGATAQPAEVAFLCVGWGSTTGGQTMSNLNGYTQLASRVTATTIRGMWFGYRFLTAAAIETGTVVSTTAETYSSAIDTYKAGPAGSIGGRQAAVKRGAYYRRPSGVYVPDRWRDRVVVPV
jgi:hypothetical protein